MSSKRRTLSLLALWALSGLLLGALTGCPPSEALITVDQTSIDFGEVLLDTTESQQLSISNDGGSLATVVFQLTGDGPFEVALTGALEVRPGDQRLMFVEATPWTQGTTTDVLRVIWGDEVNEISLSVTGITGGVDGDGDGWAVPEDCDDGDPEINPDAVEVCDGVDNDCNDIVDDTVDADGDGVYDCDDCDDADEDNFPGNDEECDEQDNDCDDEIDEGFDADEDGFTICGGDCDDGDAYVNPDAAELCNGLDEDCDTLIDEDFLGPTDDVDGDGEPYCTDCDDEDPDAFHGNIEICDGIDNDCDGNVDENGDDLDGDGFTTCTDCDDSNGAINPGAAEVCDGVDNNCSDGIDEGFDVDADGETTCAGDCDDGDPAINTAATEVCDGQDNNCDSVTDEGFDVDADGVTTCGPDGVTGNADDDCDDDAPNNFPGNPEVCDGFDNDCDGAAEDISDADSDGFTVCDGDCDDADPLNFPGNPEVCDGQDNNCDNNIDENGVDNDGDGVTDCTDCDDNDPNNFPGNTEVCDGQNNDCGVDIDEGFDGDTDGVTTCGPDGVAGNADDDCDDADDMTYPGATPSCDGVADNDCDGVDDTNELDGDSDSYTPCNGDCDDSDPGINPGVVEVCSDGVDLDCDSVAPEPCQSCAEILAEVPLAINGIYEIDPDGAGGADSFDAWCDMLTDGGGWTLGMRTTDDGVANAAMLTTYADLYDFDIGDANTTDPLRVAGMHWESLAAAGEIMVRHELRKLDGSSCDALFFSVQGTMIFPDPASPEAARFEYLSGNLHAIVNGSSPSMFSATDYGPNSACVIDHDRVPWFYQVGCGPSSPAMSSFFSPGEPQPSIIQAFLGGVGADLNGNTETDVCAGGTLATFGGGAWVVDNVHEIYFR